MRLCIDSRIRDDGGLASDIDRAHGPAIEDAEEALYLFPRIPERPAAFAIARLM